VSDLFTRERISRAEIIKLFFMAISIAALALVSFQLSKLDSERVPYFDLYDEGAHYDYVLKFSQGEIPTWGSRFDQETLIVIDCLGSMFFEPRECNNSERDPMNYAPLGFSYQAQQPPLGYIPFLVNLELEPFDEKISKQVALERLQDLRTNGTVFWTFLNSILFFMVAFILRRGYVVSILGAAVVFLNPTYIHAISTVSNDAAVVSAVLLWIICESLLRGTKVGRKTAMAFRFSIGVVLGLTKGTLLLLPAAILFLELLWAFRRRSLKTPRDFFHFLHLPGLPTLVGACFSYITFVFWQSLRGSVESSEVLAALLGFSKSEIPRVETYFQSFVNMFSLFRGSYGMSGIDGQVAELLTLGMFSILVLSATLSMLLGNSNRIPISLVDQPAIVTIIALCLTAIAWPTLSYLQGQYDFPAAHRYALMALPLMSLAIINFTNFKSLRLMPK
jgi:hypothetical protein